MYDDQILSRLMSDTDREAELRAAEEAARTQQILDRIDANFTKRRAPKPERQSHFLAVIDDPHAVFLICCVIIFFATLAHAASSWWL